MIAPLIDDIEMVNVLAVLPGIGGQPFQPAVLDKVSHVTELLTLTD